jgi:hypothetical protein
MKKWLQCMAAVVFGTFGVIYGVNAQDATTNSQPDTTLDARLYRPNELAVDLFGTGSIGQQTINHLSGDRIDHHGKLGAGAGLDCFFCRYLGIGGDAYAQNTDRSFVDSTSGNLIARLPIGESGLAPYIFGGGGYQFDEVRQSFGQAGTGLEFRFTKYLGIFVDARYVMAAKTENYGVARAGLRLSF